MLPKKFPRYRALQGIRPGFFSSKKNEYQKRGLCLNLPSDGGLVFSHKRRAALSRLLPSNISIRRPMFQRAAYTLPQEPALLFIPVRSAGTRPHGSAVIWLLRSYIRAAPASRNISLRLAPETYSKQTSSTLSCSGQALPAPLRCCPAGHGRSRARQRDASPPFFHPSPQR